MTEQEMIETAHEAVAALNAHDVESYVRCFDESCVGEAFSPHRPPRVSKRRLELAGLTRP